MWCIPWWRKKEKQHFFIKIYSSFYSFERSWSFCGLWDRRTGRGRQDRLLYWPLTSSLDHSTLCYFQDPLSTSSASRTGLLKRRPSMGPRPQRTRSQWLQAGFDSGLHYPQLSQLEVTQLEVEALSGALTLTANWRSLWPSMSQTYSTAASICVYYFITPTYFRLDHMIFFRLFTQVRLWLTTRSRVDM